MSAIRAFAISGVRPDVQDEPRTLADRDARWLEYWARYHQRAASAGEATAQQIQMILAQSRVTTPGAAVPADIVTIGTIVLLRDAIGHGGHVVWLVRPGHESDLLEKVAVTSPLGLELIGRRVGCTLRASMPRVEVTVQIQRILYQPPEHFVHGSP